MRPITKEKSGEGTPSLYGLVPLSYRFARELSVFAGDDAKIEKRFLQELELRYGYRMLDLLRNRPD